MARGIVLVHIRYCGVALASVTLFGSGSGVGNGIRCTIRWRIPFILPWSTGLGIIPRTDGVGGNRHRHNRDSGHGSLMHIDLVAKRLQDC
jgi:hypothetical protein